MAVRLVVTITAVPSKGSELAQAYRARCADAMKEPGCEQFEIFQSAMNPDRLALLERWSDQKALDVHAELNRPKPPHALISSTSSGARRPRSGSCRRRSRSTAPAPGAARERAGRR